MEVATSPQSLSLPPPKTPQTQVSSIGNDTCFRCEKQGHWVRDCPNKTPKKSPPASAGGSFGGFPHSPQTQVTGVKNDTCFRCEKQGHWARDCPNKTPKKSPPASAGGSFGGFIHPTIHCPCCGGACVSRVSRTPNNPNRMFYTCPAGSGQCKFFKWCDQLTDDDIKKLRPQSPFPKCSCGAGICRKIIESSGPNAGRAYFVCPVKKGHGACPFFQWEKSQVNIRVGEHVDESKGYGSTQSTCNSHQVFDFVNGDLPKIKDSILERSEGKEIEVPEVENPEDIPSFVSMHIPSAEDDTQLNGSCIYDPRSDMSSPENGSSTLEVTIRDLVVQEDKLLGSVMRKAIRRIPLMSETEVHCRQIEFWKQISAAEDISTEDIIYQSLGFRVLGWLGRLAFPPPRCLKDHPPRPFFCGIFPSFDPIFVFPSFDPIFVPQDGDMLNLVGSTPFPQHRSNAELDKLSPPPTPVVDRQLRNGVLWKPSGLKRSFATIQGDILVSSVSESLERTAAPILSLEQAAVQLQKRLEQAALHFQDAIVSIPNTIDPPDHNTTTMTANKFFSDLNQLQLPIDYEPFYRRVREFIESSSRLDGIEQAIHRECSLEELIELHNTEKVCFDDISKVHDEAVAAFTNSSWRHQSLQQEASRVRDMLLQIENQLSCSEAEISELKTRVDVTSKDMLDSKKRVEEAEEMLKLREQREAERCAAKAALEQARIQLSNAALEQARIQLQQ